VSDSPLKYEVNLVWTGEKTGSLSVDGKPTIVTGVPADFEGEDKYHSPEDLFVASASVCFMNGFVEFTRKMRIEFQGFECRSIGLLEKVGRSFEITRIDIRARVLIADEGIRKKIDRALELADKYCFIGNSMKCPIYHENDIVVVENR
jgi:organic hydroperoxide reductase OsmC/OhrA